MGSLQRDQQERDDKKRNQRFKAKMKRISRKNPIIEESDRNLGENVKEAMIRDKS
jgi:hypothetical protein